MIKYTCTHCGCDNTVTEPTDHHPQPTDDLVPARIAVGMTVTREIATRWNMRRYGEPAETDDRPRDNGADRASVLRSRPGAGV